MHSLSRPLLSLTHMTKKSMEECIAFLLAPDVRTLVRTNPSWNESQKVRLLTLLDEWTTLTHQYRQAEYVMKIMDKI